MVRTSFRVMAAVAVLLTLNGCSPGPSDPTAWNGIYVLDKEQSDDIDQWSSVQLSLSASTDSVHIRRDFASGRYKRFDSYGVPVDGVAHDVPQENSSKWLDNVHIGVFFRAGEPSTLSAEFSDDYRTLTTELLQTAETSTGQAEIVTSRVFELLDDGSQIRVVEKRSTRDEPLTFVFKRKTEA
ncbi:MAG: hypothetical protein R2832_00790 [Rhodothermales bacterium]